MPYTRIVGIDPSLTATGVCVIGPGDEVALSLVKSKPAGDAWDARYTRLCDTAESVAERVPRGALVVMEAPAYSRQQGSAHDRAGVWWMIYDRVTRTRDATIYPVTIQHRMRYATGKGSAQKDVVLAATVRRYDWLDITDNNIADAVLLADIGARLDDQPLGGLSVTKACWPLPKLAPFPTAPEVSPFDRADRGRVSGLR